MKQPMTKIKELRGMKEIFEKYPHYNHIIQRSAAKVLEP